MAADVVRVGAQKEGSDGLYTIDYLTEEFDLSSLGKAALVCAFRRRHAVAVGIPRVGGEDEAVCVVKAGEFDRRLRLKRS